MNEMVERVARVLAVNLPEQYATAAWPEYVDLAREVIAAMREPTEEMVEAAASEAGCDVHTTGESVAVWRAMIDVAKS